MMTVVEAKMISSHRKFAMLKQEHHADDYHKCESNEKPLTLNKLKKFSANFKLHTPIPKDLVPILSNEIAKQHEIVEKWLREPASRP